MATLLLPSTLNSHHSISTFQLRNPHFTSPLKIKPLRHSISTPLVRASKKDSYSNSNPETQQDAEANNLGVKAALSMLRFYKREISPILPRSCRYIPTCSEYSMEAYKRYGVMKGTVLTAWRLCRCNPLGGYGYDPPRWFGEISPQEGEEIDE